MVKLNTDHAHSGREGEGKSKKSRCEGSSNNNYSHGSSYKGGHGGGRGKSGYGYQGYGDRHGNDKGGKHINMASTSADGRNYINMDTVMRPSNSYGKHI